MSDDLGFNQRVAERLREMAQLLASQGADRFRVNAYERAADTVAHLREDVAAIARRGGRAALEALPTIGASIAAAIEEIARTGRWASLDRLRDGLDAASVFQTLPGVGPTLARRLHASLRVDTLEALEEAAHDGRLLQVRGIGLGRALMIRSALSEVLGRPRPPAAPPEEPDVAALLDVDAEYRRRARTGGLPLIAPRRFNPSRAEWLPVMHTRRGPWHITAMFSNTALAHRLGRTSDWVLLLFHRDRGAEVQRTVVTETRGPLKRKRVVRGRESECRSHYGLGRPRRERRARAG